MNEGQEGHRWEALGTLGCRDRVPIQLLQPVCKRMMAEVVHVAATRLVCRWREYIRPTTECPRKKPGGQEVAVAGFVSRVSLDIQTSCHRTVEQRCPKHN